MGVNYNRRKVAKVDVIDWPEGYLGDVIEILEHLRDVVYKDCEQVEIVFQWSDYEDCEPQMHYFRMETDNEYNARIVREEERERQREEENEIARQKALDKKKQKMVEIEKQIEESKAALEKLRNQVEGY